MSDLLRAVVSAVLLGVAALTSLAALAGPAYACSCASDPDAAGHLARADAVFLGRLVERDAPRSGFLRSGSDPVTYVFDVSRVYKGDVAERQGVVSAASSATCGLELRGTGPYLVFAGRGGDGIVDAEPTDLVAGLCGGTRSAAADSPQALAASLGRPGEPVSGAAPPAGTVDVPARGGGLGAPAVAAVAVALGFAVAGWRIVRRLSEGRRTVGP